MDLVSALVIQSLFPVLLGWILYLIYRFHEQTARLKYSAMLRSLETPIEGIENAQQEIKRQEEIQRLVAQLSHAGGKEEKGEVNWINGIHVSVMEKSELIAISELILIFRGSYLQSQLN